MSISSTASLGAIRALAIDRADMDNNPAITTQKWNSYISLSYKALYDKLVAAYDNDYYMAQPFQITINGSNFYALPSDFYKLLGVDLQYSASPTGWVTLKNFNFIDRNKASYLNTAITISSLAQAWYIPQPTSLQFMPICSVTAGSATITVPDSSVLTAGMNIAGDAFASGTTLLTIVNATTIIASSVATTTSTAMLLYMWIDSVLIDGVSGWEEFIIIDAAIKSGIRQENDINDLKDQRNEIVARIESMAEGRDAGQAFHVSDAMSVNGYIWGLSSIGLANLRYHLSGNQLQFACVSDDDCGGGYGYGYGGGY